MPSSKDPAAVLIVGSGPAPLAGGGGDTLGLATTLNTQLQRSMSVPAVSETVSGHGGTSVINLDGSVLPVYVGSPAVGVLPLPELFTIVDDSNDQPIIVAGARVVVSSIAPDNRGAGDGFDNTNPVALTLSATIPDTVGFRLYYGVQGSLATAAENVFTQLEVPRANKRSPRDYHIKVVDGVTSFEGDAVGAAGFETFLAAASSPWPSTYYPSVFVDYGVYALSADPTWDVAFSRLIGGASISLAVGPELRLNAGQTLSLTASAKFLENLYFSSLSAAGRWAVTAGAQVRNCTFDRGTFRLSNNGNNAILDGCFFGPSDSAASTANDNVELTAIGGTIFRGCTFSGMPSSAASPNAVLNLHTMAWSESFLRDPVVFERCQFGAGFSDDVDIIQMTDVERPVIFRDCEIQLFNTGGTGWAVNLTNCKNILFDNCRIFTSNGQGIRAANSGVTFRNCFVASRAGSVLSNPQLIVGYGNVTSTVFPGEIAAFRLENVEVELSSSNIKPSTIPTLACIELGGEATTLSSGLVQVDGLYVQPDAGAGVHNFTTILCWGGIGANSQPNSFKSIYYDAKDQSPDDAGTEDGVQSQANGTLIEIVGSAEVRPNVEDVSIVNLGEPDAFHGRPAIVMSWMMGRNINVDGSGSTSGFNYSASIIILQTGAVIDGMTAFLNNTVALANSSIKAVQVGTECYLSRLRIRGDAKLTRGLVSISGQGVLTDSVVVYEDASATFSMVRLSTAGALYNTKVYSDATSNIPIVDSLAVRPIHVTGNTIAWTVGNTNQIASFGSADDGIVMGNVFANASGGAPTVAYPASGISGDTLNQRTSNAAYATAPLP